MLLVPALAGYFIQTRVYLYRYRTLRESGQHVVFRSALTGSILIFLAQLIVPYVDARYPTHVAYINRAFESDHTASAIVSFLLAFIFWFAMNRIVGKNRAAIRAARENGELKGVFITQAIGTGKSVEVSLDTGKVYIGQIIQSGIGMSSQFDLMITPMYSGYRDRETSELKITEFYFPVIKRLVSQYREKEKDREKEMDRFYFRIPVIKRLVSRFRRYEGMRNGQRWKDLRIVISLSSVVAVRYFDPSVYQEFENVHAVDQILST